MILSTKTEPSPIVSPSPVASPSPIASPSPVIQNDIGTLENLALEAFTTIDVDIAIGDVNVVEGEDYGISLTWHENTGPLYYSCKNGELKVWGTLLGTSNQRGGSVDITVPTDTTLTQAEITTGLWKIKLTNLSADELELFTGLGTLKLRNIATKDAELNSGMGDVSLDFAS